MTRSITIVDYGMGNLSSVKNAFVHLGRSVTLTSSAEDIKRADVIILPGVGAFGEAMQNLQALNLIDILTEKVMHEKVPFLGICLGMQLIADSSEENGFFHGLKWIEGNVRKIKAPQSFRLPHIGWNNVTVKEGSILFNDLGEDKNFYFVHSFHMNCDKDIIESTTEYGGEVTASIRKDNIFATQFHPEKSHVNGMKILQNFLRLC